MGSVRASGQKDMDAGHMISKAVAEAFGTIVIDNYVLNRFLGSVGKFDKGQFARLQLGICTDPRQLACKAAIATGARVRQSSSAGFLASCGRRSPCGTSRAVAVQARPCARIPRTCLEISSVQR